jgi:hypothetical protein
MYLADPTSQGGVGNPHLPEVVGTVLLVKDGVDLWSGVGAEDQTLPATKVHPCLNFLPDFTNSANGRFSFFVFCLPVEPV